MFGLDFLRKLKPCKWRYKDELDDGVEHFGFIAQEVDHYASHNNYAFVKRYSGGLMRVQPWEFIGPIVQAIQDLDEKISKIEAQLKTLETSLNDGTRPQEVS